MNEISRSDLREGDDPVKQVPVCRLTLAKGDLMIEVLIFISYDIPEYRLNILRVTSISRINGPTRRSEVYKTIHLCPVCGEVLDKNGYCRRCGHVKMKGEH